MKDFPLGLAINKNKANSKMAYGNNLEPRSLVLAQNGLGTRFHRVALGTSLLIFQPRAVQIILRCLAAGIESFHDNDPVACCTNDVAITPEPRYQNCTSLQSIYLLSLLPVRRSFNFLFFFLSRAILLILINLCLVDHYGTCFSLCRRVLSLSYQGAVKNTDLSPLLLKLKIYFPVL